MGLSIRCAFVPVFVAVACFLTTAAGSLHAQVGFTGFTLEYVTSRSDAVVVARIVAVEPTPDFREGDPHPLLAVTLAVDDCLKGETGKRLRVAVGGYWEDRWKRWQDEETPLLWFLTKTDQVEPEEWGGLGRDGPPTQEPPANGPRTDERFPEYVLSEDGWRVYPLAERDWDTDKYRWPFRPLTLDLEPVGREALVETTRRIVRDEPSAKAPRGKAYLPRSIVMRTGGYGDAVQLIMPVDIRLDAAARRWIAEPDAFFPENTGETKDRDSPAERYAAGREFPGERFALQRAGIEALLPFPSRENEALLERVIDKAARRDAAAPIGDWGYPVDLASDARKVLFAWDERGERSWEPESTEEY